MGPVTNKATIEALKKLSDQHHGLLKPETVVEAARPESSPLHRHFCWDDTEAARLYRLDQASDLLRVTVQYFDDGKGNMIPVRCHVSLTPDRTEDGGGFRQMITVLSDAELRKQMLLDALAELEVFRVKFQKLSELALIFKAIRSTRKKLDKKLK